MKKLLAGLLAVGLVLGLTLPASAFDNEFGGYMRTRAYVQKDFAGTDTGAQDLQQVDMRVRLFYTAIFSDNFKFVNKFEFNSVWGDTSKGGGISSSTNDRDIFRIKNSYANINLGPMNFLVGIQPRILNRGFLVDSDFAGLSAAYKGAGFEIPFIWMKAYEGGMGKNTNDNDVDYYFLKPNFAFGNISLTPTLGFIYSKDARNWVAMNSNKEVQVYIAGLDADMKFGGMGSAWFTGIYEGGKADLVSTATSVRSADVGAYLLALGGTVNLGPIDVHGQAFYASGDNNATDNKVENFFVPKGQLYYWAEIMGYGIFDNQASAGSPADQISNILAANIGVGFKISDKLKLTGDLWYAKLAKSNAKGNDLLGTEIDLVLTYSVMKNLNLDVVGAYLFAGNATTTSTATNKNNAYEFGTRLSFSF